MRRTVATATMLPVLPLPAGAFEFGLLGGCDGIGLVETDRVIGACLFVLALAGNVRMVCAGQGAHLWLLYCGFALQIVGLVGTLRLLVRWAR